MDAICTSCHAIMFPWEMSQKTKTFSACCRHGTIQLRPFKDPSPALQGLFDRTSPQSQQFMANIRHYNGLVSMASRSVSGKMVEFNGRGPQPFKMSGQMYHLTPSAVFPDTNKKNKFSQIYVFDQDNEIKKRLHHAKGDDLIQVPTLTLIQNELKAVNPLVKFFKTGADIFTASPNCNLKMVFKSKSSQLARKTHLNPNGFGTNKGLNSFLCQGLLLTWTTLCRSKQSWQPPGTPNVANKCRGQHQTCLHEQCCIHGNIDTLIAKLYC